MVGKHNLLVLVDIRGKALYIIVSHPEGIWGLGLGDVVAVSGAGREDNWAMGARGSRRT